MSRETGFYDKGKTIAASLRECCRSSVIDSSVLAEAAEYIETAAEWVRALATDDVPAPVVKEKKPVKHRHGMYKNVLLTDDEYKKLSEQFRDLGTRIDRLSEYIEMTGKKYKSHYAVILNWARRDGESTQKASGFTGASFDTDEFFEAAVKKSYGDLSLIKN